MTREEVLEARSGDLQILLNLLHEDGRRLRVEYPFFDVEVFSYDPRRARFRSFVDATTFSKARNQHLPGDDFLKRDLPAWGDVESACLSAGAVLYENGEEAKEAFRRAWESARNPHAAPTFIAFDTNTFYDRIGTRIIPERFLEGAPRAPVVVSEAVRAELDRKANEKYRSSHVNQLRGCLAREDLVGALSNRAVKSSRMASAALGDLNFMTGRLRAPEVHAEDLPGGEENDRVIAESYLRFAKQNERLTRIVMLTSDSGMQTVASNKGLDTIFLEKPRFEEIPQDGLEEGRVCHLVHDLAVRFQFLTLPGTGMTVWGDWSGKTPEDWTNDVVRIQHTGSNVAKRFGRDLEASRAIQQVL